MPLEAPVTMATRAVIGLSLLRVKLLGNAARRTPHLDASFRRSPGLLERRALLRDAGEEISPRLDERRSALALEVNRERVEANARRRERPDHVPRVAPACWRHGSDGA